MCVKGPCSPKGAGWQSIQERTLHVLAASASQSRQQLNVPEANPSGPRSTLFIVEPASATSDQRGNSVSFGYRHGPSSWLCERQPQFPHQGRKSVIILTASQGSWDTYMCLKQLAQRLAHSKDSLRSVQQTLEGSFPSKRGFYQLNLHCGQSSLTLSSDLVHTPLPNGAILQPSGGIGCYAAKTQMFSSSV